jgi:protein-disulfide isomerase
MTKRQSRATKQANAERAAERAAAIRREQERKERRRRTLWVTLAVLGVLAVVVAISVGIQASRDTTGQVATPPASTLAETGNDGQASGDEYALPFGENSAPVKVAIYEDFMCPFCGDFEAESAPMLQQYVDQGDVQVQYHVISFLDGASDGSDYSTRAMNALGVVLDTAGPEAAKKFHDLLYENQPEEGTEGPSDAELVDYAVEVGARESQVRQPIEDRKFEQWVENATDAASKKKINQTPTILVNGTKVEASTTIEDQVRETQAAIEAALAD